MAAPTDVRVESNSQTTATLRWTYPGSGAIVVYRSLTTAVGFAALDGAVIAAGTTQYIDTTLEPGTRYFYKLSDDAGATFSSEVNVTAQSCLPPAGTNDAFSLPRMSIPEPADGPQGAVDSFNDLAERIEAVLGGRVLVPDECIACPSNGAVVIDCSGHCREWLIVADENINSITLQYCNDGSGNINFVVPPNVTRRIGGWPAGFGFSGDEGFTSPIVSGSNGRTVTVPTSPTGGKGVTSSSKPGTGTGIGSGSSGAGACNCIPTNGNLTIKSCSANNSLSCSTTQKLQLKVCGGRGPYTWSRTGTVNLKGPRDDAPGSTAAGSTITVTPPTNTGSAVAGVAYTNVVQFVRDDNLIGGNCAPNAGGSTNHVAYQDFGCDDLAEGICIEATNTPANESGCGAAFEDAAPCKHGTCAEVGSAGGTNCPNTRKVPADFVNDCTNFGGVTGGLACDRRTAPMIAANCTPCGLNSGNTVTVTDSLGTQVSIVLRP